MAHNLTETNEFTASISVPDPGDDRKSASVNTPFQALANRTKYLKAVQDGYDAAPHTFGNTIQLAVDTIIGAALSPAELIYNEPKSRPVLLPMHITGGSNGWTQGNAQPWTTTGNGVLTFHFGREAVPSGSRLKKIRAGVSLANTVALSAVQTSPGFAPVGGWVNLGSPIVNSYTPSGTEAVALDVDMNWTIDNSGQRYEVQVAPTSGLTILWWLLAFFDDVGPRNG